MQRIPRTRHEYSGVIIVAHETRVREDLMTHPGKPWSWQRHAKEHLLHHCGNFRTLRRVIVMVAGALDEGRIGGLNGSTRCCAGSTGYSRLQRRTVATT